MGRLVDEFLRGRARSNPKPRRRSIATEFETWLVERREETGREPTMEEIEAEAVDLGLDGLELAEFLESYSTWT
jgi:hypothetical protein